MSEDNNPEQIRPENQGSEARNSVQLEQSWLSLIIEASEEAIFSLDKNWCFTYVNQYAALQFGRTAESLLGKSVWEEFPGLAGSNFGKFYRQVVEEGKPGRLEEFSGTTQSWYEIRAYPVPQGLVAYFRDINNRKQAEQQLRESEERYRVLSAATFEGVALHRFGEIILANESLAQLLGYASPEEMVGVSLLQHLSQQTLAEVRQRWAAKPTEGEAEGVMMKKDGTFFATEGRGKMIDYKGQPAQVAVVRDITERKQKEQELRESERRFKVLSEAAFEGVLIHNNETVVEANLLAAQLFGYNNATELLGLRIEQLLTPATFIELQKRAAEGSEEAYEGTAVRKDGTLFPVEARAKAAIYKGKAVRLKVLRDITERKQAEENLRKTQAQLAQAQKMESVGRLAGGVAHDFNNILTAILGYAELSLMELGENDPLYSNVSEIRDAAERAATLTRQLLAFSRQQVVQPRRLNLNEVIRQLDKMLQRLIGENIEIDYILEPDVELVMADPGQIEQIIVNLAVNARDAMPDGGQLVIETANVELDEQYRVTGHPQFKTGAYVMLTVSDTGEGMDQATQEKIFEPFFTTKEVGKGTGLGLATVYGIIQQSEGYVMVYSELGLGTIFKIYLPVAKRALTVLGQAATSVTNSVANKGLSGGQGRIVLVVEDNQLVRELIERVLSQAGYKVLTASNGQRALELLSRYSAGLDAVLTDMVMPKMGGRELIIRLKERWPALRILCMSGYTEQSSIRHAIIEECNYYLQKPFTPTTLLNRLQEVLS